MQEDHTKMVMEGIRAATDKPVWAKLSPNAGDLVSVALAAEEASSAANATETRSPAFGDSLAQTGLSVAARMPSITILV